MWFCKQQTPRHQEHDLGLTGTYWLKATADADSACASSVKSVAPGLRVSAAKTPPLSVLATKMCGACGFHARHSISDANVHLATACKATINMRLMVLIVDPRRVFHPAPGGWRGHVQIHVLNHHGQRHVMICGFLLTSGFLVSKTCAVLSKEPVTITAASTGFQATDCTLSVWCS